MKKILCCTILLFSLSLCLYSQNIKEIKENIIKLEGSKESFEKVEYNDSIVKTEGTIKYTIIGYYEDDYIKKIEVMYYNDIDRNIEYYYFDNKKVILCTVMKFHYFDLQTSANMFFLKHNRNKVSINGKFRHPKKSQLNMLVEGIYSDIEVYRKILRKTK